MSNHLSRAALPAALLLVPVACGGGGGRSGTFAPPASQQNAGKVPVTLKIDVPKSTGASSKVRAQYVSPATTQMVINIQTGCPGSCSSVSGYPMTVGLTPTSGGCTSGLANTYCQLTLSLAAGSYTAALTREDASGNALSTDQYVAITVTEGAANVVSLSLSGIPAGIAVAQFGSGSSAFIANAIDVDNNVIVGPGSPSLTVNATSGIPVYLTQPTATSPNAFYASTDATGTATLSVAANYGGGLYNACSAPAAVCSGSFTLTSASPSTDLFVANYFGELLQFAPPYTGTPIALNPPGIDQPFQIAFNTSGNLFVANTKNASVTEYDPPYTGEPIATITDGLVSPFGVAFDASSDLFIADSQNDDVIELAPPYTSAPVATITNGLAVPYALTVNSSGDLFVSDVGAGSVFEYASPYTGAPLRTISTGISAPVGLYLNASNELFVANGNNTITGYASPYTAGPVLTMDDPSLSDPWFLAMDSSNNLYVSNPGNYTITVYASPYTGAPATTITNGLSGPAGLAFHTVYALSIAPVAP